MYRGHIDQGMDFQDARWTDYLPNYDDVQAARPLPKLQLIGGALHTSVLSMDQIRTKRNEMQTAVQWMETLLGGGYATNLQKVFWDTRAVLANGLLAVDYFLTHTAVLVNI